MSLSQLEKESQDQNRRRVESEEKRKTVEANPKKASLQERIKELDAEIAALEQPMLTAQQVQRFIDNATETLSAIKAEVAGFQSVITEYKLALKQLATTDQAEQQLITKLSAYLEKY